MGTACGSANCGACDRVSEEDAAAVVISTARSVPSHTVPPRREKSDQFVAAPVQSGLRDLNIDKGKEGEQRDIPQFDQAPSPKDSPRNEHKAVEIEKEVDEQHYDGDYLGRNKHGKGRLQLDGRTYEGDFFEDEMHGSGVLRWDDNRQYSGQFREGKFHGFAKMIWPDGREYVGHYLLNRKHGDGTFKWADGRKYQGQWIEGKRHGVGVYTNAKGESRSGTWGYDQPVHWSPETPAVRFYVDAKGRTNVEV